MKFTSTLIAIVAGLGVANAMPAPGVWPEGVVVTEYPHGLPAEIRPHANKTEKRDAEVVGLQKRGPVALEVEKRGPEAEDLEKRQQYCGVYLCNDWYFQGYCVHISQPCYQCINLSGDLNDRVSSLGPDGSNYCLFYSAFNCNDIEGHFGTFGPGYNDLGSIGWNDKISSYICYPN